MVFNSVTFVVFLALVFVLHWTVPKKFRNPVLLVGSYVFYGAWDWRFLGLLLVSTGADFTLARLVHASEDRTRRLRLLWTSVALNLGILGVFKYTGFFVDSFEELAESVGLDASGPTLSIILPVGISFYTFQPLSYTFDVYRRRLEPTTDIITFATYVAYFPQLVAGPIERAQALLPRLTDIDRERPRGAELEHALGLMLLGLFKKVVIADGVGSVADAGFAGETGWVAALVGVVAFSLQIYGDFSGYTDIARGVSRLFGIELVLNFSQPYLSRNITEFWRRWHISLSNWLRDYLYIPLGGNRGGATATMRNLMITMVLGGLWHGASWTFVIWGTLHGAFLAVHRIARGGQVPTGPVSFRQIPSVLATFGLVAFAWIFFRADSAASAFEVIEAIVTFRSGEVVTGDVVLVVLMSGLVLALDLLQRRVAGTLSATPSGPVPVPLVGVGLAMAMLGILVFSGGTPQPFIYFQL